MTYQRTVPYAALAVCLMGYGFGAPLLYGGSVIPVALPASLALVALGIGLTAAAGAHTWPINILLGPSTRARLLRALLPAVVLLALIHDWITAILLEHSDPSVVLASAMTAISFLLVVSYAVTRVSGAIGDAIDRTQAERKRAEEMRARLAAIVESLNDAIIGRDLVEIFPSQSRREQVERRNLRWAGQPQVDYETVLIAKDGRCIDVTVSAFPIKDNSVNVIGTAAILRDIIERKRTEEELKAQAQQLAQSNEELTRFNHFAAGRKLRMIELKQEVNDLAAKLGQPRPYALAFMDAAAARIVRSTPKPTGLPSFAEPSQTSNQKEQSP